VPFLNRDLYLNTDQLSTRELLQKRVEVHLVCVAYFGKM
jgi:hypothetical protein